MTASSSSTRRATCAACLRAQNACICHWVRPLSSRVNLLILQHPLEVRNAKNSARLLHLCLPGSRLEVGEAFPDLHALLYADGRVPVLLYPETPGYAPPVVEPLPPERLRRCEGVGVATPSQMDGQGRVRLAPLLGWREVDLADLVRAQLPVRVPVLADNDANAFAIGATYHGQEPPSGVTLFLVMESGVGGGIVFDGKLFRGGNGVAGEVGHLLVPDADGEYRALERIVGLEVLLDRYRRLAGGNPLLPDLLSDVAAGKRAALGVARDWARALAFGLVQACRIIDPDRIVLGGSVAALYAPMAGHVVDAMAALQDSAFLLPEIVVTELEGSGPAFGAACMMHQRYLSLESQRLSEAADDDG